MRIYFLFILFCSLSTFFLKIISSSVMKNCLNVHLCLCIAIIKCNKYLHLKDWGLFLILECLWWNLFKYYFFTILFILFCSGNFIFSKHSLSSIIHVSKLHFQNITPLSVFKSEWILNLTSQDSIFLLNIRPGNHFLYWFLKIVWLYFVFQRSIVDLFLHTDCVFLLSLFIFLNLLNIWINSIPFINVLEHLNHP